MYFRRIETSKAALAQHIDNLKYAARLRLDRMDHKRRPECAANRAAASRLNARVKDWEQIKAGVTGGYNKPGSMKLQ